MVLHNICTRTILELAAVVFCSNNSNQPKNRDDLEIFLIDKLLGLEELSKVKNLPGSKADETAH